jgi:hypothetical protein
LAWRCAATARRARARAVQVAPLGAEGDEEFEVVGQARRVLRPLVRLGGLLDAGGGRFELAEGTERVAQEPFHRGGLGGAVRGRIGERGVAEPLGGRAGLVLGERHAARLGQHVGQPLRVVQGLGQLLRAVEVGRCFLGPAQHGQGAGQDEPGVGLVIAVDRLRKPGEGLLKRLDRLLQPTPAQLGVADQEDVVALEVSVVALRVDSLRGVLGLDRGVEVPEPVVAAADCPRRIGFVAAAAQGRARGD